jgi:hypothetical protein
MKRLARGNGISLNAYLRDAIESSMNCDFGDYIFHPKTGEAFFCRAEFLTDTARWELVNGEWSDPVNHRPAVEVAGCRPLPLPYRGASVTGGAN